MVTIGYQIVVDQDTPGVSPRAQDGGGCGQPGASGLIPFEQVEGMNQQYCLCDEGPCGSPTKPAVTLKQGTYPATFTWDKHTWFGPSDTGNPEGPLFTVGDYTLQVNAIGTQLVGANQVGFNVTGTLPIRLTP
jgi:hypothetical protein